MTRRVSELGCIPYKERLPYLWLFSIERTEEGHDSDVQNYIGEG